MSEPNKPLPVPNNETAPFWKAAGAGRLEVQRCGACSRHVFYPRLVCPYCMSEQLDWVEVSGRGKIYSFTLVHKAPPAFRGEVPYPVALIELDEGVRMMSRLMVENHTRLRIGMPVRVRFEAASEEISLPVFELVEDA
ncbi:MAG: Zn-ribbon domain-containing OB-fold protein [Ectothiorhodospiraceae bacterium]|nr:Zn-ribbon domain-containing OB-fold protein [Ectothiorhodospiraceae bacterium]MCH8504180.1 Zn-ribbon domain-containing OB-fold protein [Ectothiorhodospiraceae bacterium]